MAYTVMLFYNATLRVESVEIDHGSCCLSALKLKLIGTASPRLMRTWVASARMDTPQDEAAGQVFFSLDHTWTHIATPVHQSGGDVDAGRSTRTRRAIQPQFSSAGIWP